MNIDKIFPSKYLKASDLGENQPTVTIEEVKFEAVGRDKEMKGVAYFKGKEKGMVLNVTNCKRIASIAGSNDTDDWAGVKVCLFATETEFGGETVDCIRIKSAKANGAKAPVAPPPAREPGDEDGDDNIGF